METKSSHFILDVWGIDYQLLDSVSELESLFLETIRISRCQILNKYCHKFQPQGVTLVFVLSESHCSIHTWPEVGYAAIDLYGCSNPKDLELGIEHLIKELKPTKHQLKKIIRGDSNE